MKKEDAKMGVVVRLKSGGPRMTLSEPNPTEASKWTAAWFVDDELHWGRFSVDELVISSHQAREQEPIQ